jgi:uncharacterized protein (TIGR02453 family)
MATSAFPGFSKDTVRFLAGLSKNNEKVWFDAHRDDYEADYMAPAKAFVEAIAPRLRKIDASIHAEPRVNGSIMRINRDIRFSKDKAPYKDHMDLYFWTGKEKGWESSGFFFRLTPTRLMVGGGMHGFMPPVLARYREAVLDSKKGAALAKVAAGLRAKGYEVGGESYKKTPRGVAEDHPRAALLKHGGIHAGWEGKHPKELGTGAIVDFVAKHFAAVSPLHEWLERM